MTESVDANATSSNNVEKQLEEQIEYYRCRYAELENKVNEIWSQREAFRLASERMSDTMVKRECGSQSSRVYRSSESESDNDTDEADVCRPILPYQTSVSFKVTKPRRRPETARVPCRKTETFGSTTHECVQQQRQALTKLINMDKKLYAFKVLNAEVKSNVPLYLNVAGIDTSHKGNILVSETAGIFKITKVPPIQSNGTWNNVGQCVLGFLGMGKQTTLSSTQEVFSNVLGSFADYTGLKWLGDKSTGGLQGSQTSRDPSTPQTESHPHCQIKYMSSLEPVDGSKMQISLDAFPGDCNIACIFNGRWDTLVCVETTRGVDSRELYGHPDFTFVLETQLSKRSKENKLSRYNNQLRLINSGTGHYLCIDLLTRRISFTSNKTRYVVPLLFKMVPFSDLLVNTVHGPGAVLHNLNKKSLEYNDTCDVNRYVEATNTTSRFVDSYGNFCPLTRANGTPAPSPRIKECSLRSVNLNTQDDDEERVSEF
ncbi:hypothetical protein BdWA1_001376 [Babesia duncani]|uniref:Uncharacterized protein n=1 Tax=Babesia duncani TaxID=323732 RepID=A0AAD9PP58_9APIC|nr:hypothetical protein BdWA1_001376 [Babesia duncani]